MIALLLVAASVLAPAQPPQIVRSVAIAGRPGYAAVSLALPQPAIGVVDTRTNSLVWSRSVAAIPGRLASPGPPGLFQAIVRTGKSATFAAFTFEAGAVQTAITGQASGEVSGDAGVSVANVTVRVANHDRAHTGAVAYQSVTVYTLSGDSYVLSRALERPDYPGDSFPTPSVLFATHGGSAFLLRTGVASTEAERGHGLMYVQSLDPDEGMLFTWPDPSSDPFWMDNTYVALTVAFVNSSGVIIGMDDMAPLTVDFHYAPGPYTRAIEANQGYFTSHGIMVGDRVIVLGRSPQPIPLPN